MTVLLVGQARGEEAAVEPKAPSSPVPSPLAGGVTLGLAGSLVSAEGTTGGSVALRGGIVMETPLGQGVVEIETAYAHVSSLDILDVELGIAHVLRVGETPWHPYLGLAGGVRQEWVGSFRETRYPVGLNVGVLALVSPGAALRAEYRLRRVLDDPVADVTEHRAQIGVTLILGGDPGNPSGPGGPGGPGGH